MCQSGVCTGYSVLQVTVDADFDRLLADAQAMDEFKQAFSRSVAATIGVSTDRVRITNIEPGSVLVSFFIAPSSAARADDNAISAVAAVRRIRSSENATAANTLRDNLLAEGISCTDPCSVTMVSSATQQEPTRTEAVTRPSKTIHIAAYVAVIAAFPLCLVCGVWFACKRLRSTKKPAANRESEQTDNPLHERAQTQSTQRQQQQEQQLPPGWVERFDRATERVYFANASTRERTWTRPTSGAHVTAKAQTLAMTSESWVQRTDTASGRSYYVNLSTGQSSWSLPEGSQVGRNVQRHERVASEC